MNYYKIINDTTFVGVATSHDFRVFQHKHKIILACDEQKAQYVQHQDKFYRANWMVPVETDKISYETVEVIKIDEEEYNILLDAVETGKEIEIEQEVEPPVVDEPIIGSNEVVTVGYVKESKIDEMDRACTKTIQNGFDATLSDGGIYHFSLTITDQLNISSLNTKALAGESPLPYHADGQPCKFYPAEDIMLINKLMEELIILHTTYFNSLKTYINALDNIKDIGAVYYGVDIPQEYQSEVLKVLMGGDSND